MQSEESIELAPYLSPFEVYQENVRNHILFSRGSCCRFQLSGLILSFLTHAHAHHRPQRCHRKLLSTFQSKLGLSSAIDLATANFADVVLTRLLDSPSGAVLAALASPARPPLPLVARAVLLTSPIVARAYQLNVLLSIPTRFQSTRLRRVSCSYKPRTASASSTQA